MRIVAGRSCSAADSATACAWLPDEAVTTPRTRPSWAIALYAPRNLNAPIRCRFSGLSRTVGAGALVERARADDRRAVGDAVEARGRAADVVEVDHAAAGVCVRCAAAIRSWTASSSPARSSATGSGSPLTISSKNALRSW